MSEDKQAWMVSGRGQRAGVGVEVRTLVEAPDRAAAKAEAEAQMNVRLETVEIEPVPRGPRTIAGEPDRRRIAQGAEERGAR